MNNTLKIKIKSYDSHLVDLSIKKIMEIANMNNAKYEGPIPLPIKKEIFTILRATHKYKDSREQFERITFTRLLYIQNQTPKIMKELSNLVLPYGVNVDISTK